MFHTQTVGEGPAKWMNSPQIKLANCKAQKHVLTDIWVYLKARDDAKQREQLT